MSRHQTFLTKSPGLRDQFLTFKVKTTDSGERIITHQLRQLIYSVDAGAFIPTTVAIPSAVAELTKSTLGITTSLAKSIQATAGPNLIALEAPNLYSVVFDEFSKGFYTYQIFMAWLWLNFSYWHMGIIYTVVVCVGGLSVAYVSFSNRAMLYALIYREVSQRALVLRDSNFIRLRAVEIVPGDLIAVEPGPCVADMVRLILLLFRLVYPLICYTEVLLYFQLSTFHFGPLYFSLLYLWASSAGPC